MTDLHGIAVVLEQIAVHSSSITKGQLLKRHEKLVGFKDVLYFIYNPYIRTGISTAKINKVSAASNGAISLAEALQYFNDNQTGSNADVAFGRAFIEQQPTTEAKKLALAIVTKDLKIGVTATTLNKIFGKTFIPKTGIMRGVHYSDFKSKVNGPFIVTEKIDGGRRLLFKENGKITIYTRSGHTDSGLVDLEREAAFLPDNKVYDIEAAAIGDFKSGIELRQATNSILARNGNRTGLYFNVFDIIPVSHFKAGESLDNAVTRKALLAAIFGDTGSLSKLSASVEGFKVFKVDYDFKYIRPLPILGVVKTEEEIYRLAQPIWDRKFEGVMLNTLYGLYEVSDSPRQQLLKVKANEELVVTCTGVYEGEGRLEGKLGGICFNYKGFEVKAGSGFNDAQREMYWNDTAKIIGKKIEIEHFGESSNQQGGVSLNCPIFKRVRGETE